MKVRIGESDVVSKLAAKAEECMDIGRRAQRIECGITQFEWLISADRLERVKEPAKPGDLQESLNMTIEEAQALRTKMPEGAQKEIEAIRKAADALSSEVRRLPAGREIEKAVSRLRKKARTLRSHMEAVWTAARYACSIPRPIQKPEAARVAGRGRR